MGEYLSLETAEKLARIDRAIEILDKVSLAIYGRANETYLIKIITDAKEVLKGKDNESKSRSIFKIDK